MYVRRLKRKCIVRGCKNTVTFAISRRREPGNSVIICEDCLKSAIDAIKNIAPGEKNNIPVNNSPAFSLFFDEGALGIGAKNDTAASEVIKADSAELVNDAAHVCSDCGRSFDSAKGLAGHRKHCKGRSDNE